MVSIITGAGQAFARPEVRAALELDPIWVAIVAAVLVAFYQVRFAQQCSLGQCAVLVPLSALILFGLALASNNLVASQQEKPTPARVAEASTAPDLVANLKQQVDIQNKLIQEMEKALASSTPHAASDSGAKLGWLDAVLGAMVGEAHAQEMTAEERKALLRKIRESQTNIKQLEVKQKTLEQPLPRPVSSERPSAAPPAQDTLWKTWGGAKK
jgi:hypothetical protein